ncbi:uncharacterized protein LOC119730472 isoform X2 [Patiria miniata]|uniref:Uncharacterized protein n=1 Tax=Patiria miniata TaxID=46514 RepID=A0A914A634_PATMI|nr:uncharacterized protein LOC119730472 isoform X2 [Patiria miniata]
MATIIKIITGAEHRPNSMYVMKCIPVTNNLQIAPVFMNHEAVSRFKVGFFYRLIGHTTFKMANDEMAIQISARTQNFQWQPFDIPPEVEEGFFHAFVLSVEEVLKLPPHTRTSIQGTLTYVSTVKEATTWKKRTLRLSDPSSHREVVNLWNMLTSKPLPHLNLGVVVCNVVTTMHQGQVSCNTTPETDIKEQIITKEIQITGYCEERFNVLIISEADEEFCVTKQMLLDLANVASLEDFQLKLPDQ